MPKISKQKYCPKCGSPKLKLMPLLGFGLSPTVYFCEECGYKGPIYLESEKLPKKKYTKKPRSRRTIIMCPRCGYENSSEFKYCGKCGEQLREFRQNRPPDYIGECPKCGFVNNKESKYCGKCGTRLEDETVIY